MADGLLHKSDVGGVRLGLRSSAEVAAAISEMQARLSAADGAEGDSFGYSVALSGDTALVGADSDDIGVVDQGSAYVFVRSGTTWAQQAYLKASNTEANDYFGYAVAVSGDTVVVGAMHESSSASGINGNQSDNSGSSAGAAYALFRAKLPLTPTQTADLAKYVNASRDENGEAKGIRMTHFYGELGADAAKNRKIFEFAKEMVRRLG